MNAKLEFIGKERDGEGKSSVSRDTIHTVLSNRRRRWILHYLKGTADGSADFRTLVDVIAAWENDQPAATLSWKQRKRVYTALRQSHLPKLDDADVIDYDRSRGRISLTEDARDVQLYLEYVPGNDIPWSQYYAGLTLVGIVLVVATTAGIVPFAALSGTALSWILVAMIACSALVHVSLSRRTRLGRDGPPPDVGT